MSIRYQRNQYIILGLLGILLFLAIVLGNQPIVAPGGCRGGGMRKLTTFFLVVTLLATLTACSGTAATPTAVVSTTRTSTTAATGASTATSASKTVVATPTTASASKAAATAVSASTKAAATTVKTAADDAVVTLADAIPVKLEGDKIVFAGKGATVNGKTLTIAATGAYNISGKLNNGQIVVDTQAAEKVVLLLNGASITNATGAGIYVANTEKVVITLVEGHAEQRHRRGQVHLPPIPATDAPNAAIFSHDHLTINGTGSLMVKANYNNGITSKDDLKNTRAADIVVQAANDGLRGHDSLTVKAGTLTITQGSDGLQANNDEHDEQGYVVIEGGTLNITAGRTASRRRPT